MTIGAVVIWLAVVGIAVYAGHFSRRAQPEKAGKLLIVGGGVVFPTLVLAALLIHGLMLLPELLAPAAKGSLTVSVTGLQWWWRVRYLQPGREPAELANEIHLPVGTAVEFQLDSPDVIHSFWIPSLGGKMDMIPGRRTRLRLTPTRLGTLRGLCAEYCGTSHALMSFSVVVEPPERFERWLDRQREPARPPAGAAARRGRDVFLASGCGACHALRGEDARGVIGPDLTHVGGRLGIGAGVLPKDEHALRRFVAHTDRLKPGVHMPAFGMLPAGDLNALAAYLDGLR